MIVGYVFLLAIFFWERARDDMEAVRIVMSGMWMQDVGSLSSGNTKLLVIFVGMVAFAMVVQAIAVIVLAIGAVKARKRALEIAEEVREKLMPVISVSHDIIRDAGPKVKIITENLVETSHTVRRKAQEFDATASELNMKTRAQAARVDGMVTSVLNTTAEISETLQRAVKVPVREFTGLVNGFKAGVDVLVGRAKGFGRGPANGARGRDTEW
jgi:methyl-accepting chemotaxis protein